MYIVEYQGSNYGATGPRIRDGAGHRGIHRKFENGSGDIEVFLSKPPGLDKEHWRITEWARREDVYLEDVVAQLEERAQEVQQEHRDRRDLFVAAAKIKAATGGVLATSYIVEQLEKDPEFQGASPALEQLENQRLAASGDLGDNPDGE